MARRTRYTRIYMETQSIAQEIEKLQFSGFHGPSATWEPHIDVFRYEDRIEICAELAGVAREDIELSVLPRSVTLQGTRQRSRSDCPGSDPQCRQTLAMEIPAGPFQRQIPLPLSVDPEKVTARQDNGLLRIILPLANS